MFVHWILGEYFCWLNLGTKFIEDNFLWHKFVHIQLLMCKRIVPRLRIFKQHCIQNKDRYGNFLNAFKKDEIRYPLQFNKVKFDWKLTLCTSMHLLVWFDFKCHLLIPKSLVHMKHMIYHSSYNFYCTIMSCLIIKLQNLSHFNVCLHGSSYFFCLLYLFILPFFHAAFSWLTNK